MMKAKTTVWILPKEKIIIITDFPAVPTGVCNLSDELMAIVAELGGAKEFDEWGQATDYVHKLMEEKKLEGEWEIEYDNSFSRAYPDDEYDDEYRDSDDSDEWEELLEEECGMYEGTCLLAGTEHCDFECPFSR